tara:strand:+ start:526 stop:726 length:201 start_codon:yes stop_codon:yes gene_type:complete
MDSKRFYTGDLVAGYCHYTRTEVYGIIINDDVFHDVDERDQYVKVVWNDGKVTTSNTLGMIKAREQ